MPFAAAASSGCNLSDVVCIFDALDFHNSTICHECCGVLNIIPLLPCKSGMEVICLAPTYARCLPQAVSFASMLVNGIQHR